MASHLPRLRLFLAVSLVLAGSCLAESDHTDRVRIGSRQTQQPFGDRQRSKCSLDRINSLEPTDRIQCDAGTIEVWDHTEDEFRCAGVAVVRQIIQPNGLLLPSFTNAPQLIYIVRGRGIQGLVLPGCPETFQQSQFGRAGWSREEEFGRVGGDQSRRRFQQDQHQKIRNFSEGDVLVLPAGAAHWLYNDGDRELVAIVLLDTTSNHNQLDVHPRRFYLAGNPEDEHQTQRGRHSQQPFTRRGDKPGGSTCNNIFCGFDAEILAEAFNVDLETARRLQNDNDNRNSIVKVEGRLHVLRPQRRESEWEREGQSESSRRETEWWRPSESTRYQQCRGRRCYNTDSNGLEETICNMRLRENIADPSRADIYTPQAGRINTLNNQKLAILSLLELSAEHGVLHNNAMMVPHWNMEAHSVIYAIRGRARIQVVDSNGRAVFDEELQQGRVLVVPQNFAVVKRAENEEFEWIAFKTTSNAMISPLAGRTSVIRALPDEVVASAYRISIEDARRLKYNRKETTVFRAARESGAQRRSDA